MSEQAIGVLLERRAQLHNEVQALQSTIFHIDGALRALGYRPGNGKPGRGRLFARGELIALVGEAERSGRTTAREVARYLLEAKSLDPEDETLLKRMIDSVKDCRKRTSSMLRAAKSAE